MRIKSDFLPACRADEIAPSPSRSAGLLPAETFATVVANAPLVSIDLIVEDGQRRILLGCRRNPPAKDYWFVPGGRVRKHETLSSAFLRLTREELGITLKREDAVFQGVYEHFYDTDFSGEAKRSTHYIVLAYRLQLTAASCALPPQQHSEYQWIEEDRIDNLASVHPYTRAYFTTA